MHKHQLSNETPVTIQVFFPMLQCILNYNTAFVVSAAIAKIHILYNTNKNKCYFMWYIPAVTLLVVTPTQLDVM